MYVIDLTQPKHRADTTGDPETRPNRKHTCTGRHCAGINSGPTAHRYTMTPVHLLTERQMRMARGEMR